MNVEPEPMGRRGTYAVCMPVATTLAQDVAATRFPSVRFCGSSVAL